MLRTPGSREFEPIQSSHCVLKPYTLASLRSPGLFKERRFEGDNNKQLLVLTIELKHICIH